MKKNLFGSLFAISMIATALVLSCSKKDDLIAPVAVTGIQLFDNEIVIMGGGYSHFNGYHLARKC